MRSTDHAELPTPPDATIGFVAVLEQAMRLTASEQRQLATVLATLSGEYARPTTPESDVFAGGVSLQDWIATLRPLQPREQLHALDEALVDAAPEEALVINAERRALLAADPTLAIRLSVERIAAQSPVSLVVGVIGIGWAVYAIARGLFRLVL